MMGGAELKPAAVLKLWRQTGTLLYTYNSPTGVGQYGGGAATPVTPMDGGLGARVDETMKAMEMQFVMLEKVVGFNVLELENMAAKSANPNKADGEKQPLIIPNVLKPILKGVEEIKKSAGTSILRRMQIGIRNSEKIRESYAGVISPTDIEAMRLMESDGVLYGLTLNPKPDAIQKARFENWINIALQNTREERPGIDLNDAIYFMSRLENGADINELEKELEYAIEKNKQEAQRNSQMMIQQQAQANAQAEQSKVQGEMALRQAESEGKAKEEIVRGEVKARITRMEQNYQFLQQLHEAKLVEEGLINKVPGK
jgi:hypothetical protein